MNYGKIFYCDIANGIGCRTALFVSGCTHHCKECFNPETWDFNFGQLFDTATEDKIIESLLPDYINGLSILGGEPMEPANQIALYPFLQRVKAAVPHATIWIYTGYTIEELMDVSNTQVHTEVTEKILRISDILVDGEFILAQKNICLRFRGSTNQRIISLADTFGQGKLVLSNYMN